MSEQINFHQLIDVAFAAPPQQLVNVKYLQAFMHGLVHLLEIDNVKIELKGGPFAKADDLIKALGTKSDIEVAQYETQRNESTGKFDKKKQRQRKQKVCIDTVMVIKADSGTCPSTPAALLDKCKQVKAPCSSRDKKMSECHKEILNIETCLEHVLQKVDTCDSAEFSHEMASESSIQSSSTNVNQNQSVCQLSDIVSDVDTRLLSCIQEMTLEIEQIKCQLRKTQHCITRICENSKTLAASSDETDAKFDEIMKLFDDYEKRISRNCADICACQKQIEDNVRRIDSMYEEIEVLFKTKAEKAEVETCLALKADKCELELKVDLDVFNHVKAELSDGILDCQYRIKQLSNELDARVKQICQCLSTKIDKDAFSMFARCVEDRIKQINMETKKWISVKKREVCPFTTTPYAQNLQCGACHQAVVMKGVEANVPILPSLPHMTWNCYTKSLTCHRTGGPHTTTTAQDRCPKHARFYQHFGGPSFDVTAAECRPEHVELNFPETCFDTLLNEQPTNEQQQPNEQTNEENKKNGE